MNIEQFAKKPQLIKIEINDEAIVEAYNEPVSFYIYDNVDISTYFDYFKSQTESDGQKIYDLLRKLIRNEKGEVCIPDDHILPVDLVVASLTAINERLGKSKTKSSTQTTGNQSA